MRRPVIAGDGWRPSVMARLCARALEAGVEVEYVRDLIRKRGLISEEPPVEIETETLLKRLRAG